MKSAVPAIFLGMILGVILGTAALQSFDVLTSSQVLRAQMPPPPPSPTSIPPMVAVPPSITQCSGGGTPCDQFSNMPSCQEVSQALKGYGEVVRVSVVCKMTLPNADCCSSTVMTEHCDPRFTMASCTQQNADHPACSGSTPSNPIFFCESNCPYHHSSTPSCNDLPDVIRNVGEPCGNQNEFTECVGPSKIEMGCALVGEVPRCADGLFCDTINHVCAEPLCCDTTNDRCVAL